MANQGAKKRKEENARHMKTLLRLIIASNVRLNQISPKIFLLFLCCFCLVLFPDLSRDRTEFGEFFDTGDLCSVEDGSVLLEFHMEAFVRPDFDFARLRDSVPAAGGYGKTCLHRWRRTSRRRLRYEYWRNLWVRELFLKLESAYLFSGFNSNLDSSHIILDYEFVKWPSLCFCFRNIGETWALLLEIMHVSFVDLLYIRIVLNPCKNCKIVFFSWTIGFCLVCLLQMCWQCFRL